MRRFVLVLGLLLLGLAGVAAMMGWGSLGGAWFRASPGSLNAFQAATQRYLLPEIWTDGMVPVLRQPAWLVAGTVGAVLSIGGLAWPHIGRRR
jgi:hypothetical protein